MNSFKFGDRPSVTVDDKYILRFEIERLWKGDIIALGYLRHIFHGFARWKEIYFWLYQNNIRGYKIREYFQNESALPDGRGMLEPVRRILARIDGDKKRKITKKDLRK